MAEPHLRIIAHLDMDAFFASVEQSDNPALRGRPVIVGGLSDRGVVAAASYEARRFGVRSAMPMVTARRLCPQATFLTGRGWRYSEISSGIMGILGRYSPLVEKASIDEAYFDLTGTERLLGPSRSVARAIQTEIQASYGLTGSIGLAPNKMLAKIASDMEKPNGLTVVEPESAAEFLSPLPVGKLPGIGPKTESLLSRLGIRYVADILKFPEGFWRDRLGERGLDLRRKALGLDDRPVICTHPRKSCGAENTFAQDTRDPQILKRWLLKQSEEVGRTLRRKGLKGRTLTLKIKDCDFQQRTKRTSLDFPTSATQDIYDAACALLDGIRLSKPVRLIGLSLSSFTAIQEQLPLLPCEQRDKRSKIDEALDAIWEQYGRQAVFRASLASKKKPGTEDS
jgi:DNA polymerase-4